MQKHALCKGCKSCILYFLPSSVSGRDRSSPNVKIGNTVSLMIRKWRPLYELNWQMKRCKWYDMSLICWQGRMNENMKMKYFSKKSWLLWMLWQGQDLEMWRSLLSINRFSVIYNKRSKFVSSMAKDLTVHFSFWYGTRDAFHVCNHHLFCRLLWRLLSHETSCIKHWFDFNPDVLFYGKQVCIIFVPKPAHNRSKYFCRMQRTKTVRVLTAALHATR